MRAGLGRFGPYVELNRVFASVPAVDLLFTITLDEALERIRNKNKRPVLRELGAHPETGANLQVLKGTYGPYVTDGEVNATIGKDGDPEDLTMDEAVRLLAEAAARPKKARGRKTAKKKTTKKTTKKKTTKKKTAKKKHRQEGNGQEDHQESVRTWRREGRRERLVTRVTVVGGGLAGSEAALQLARRGVACTLVEMRPDVPTPAHRSGRLAEIVCSNSLKSTAPATPGRLLKDELDLLDCRLLACARAAAVPAGAALAVDRDEFSARVEEAVAAEPLITLERREVVDLPPRDDHLWLLATGPLTGAALVAALDAITGSPALHFFDAIAPTVTRESLDLDVLYRAARYDKGDADYLNAPLDREQYDAFWRALTAAERAEVKAFDKADLFDGLPARGGDRRRRPPQPGLRAPAPGGPARPAHRPAAPRGGPAPPGEPRGHPLRSGRVPDPLEAGGAT